jgi:hypothetical protein
MYINPSELLYDLKIVSLHPNRPGTVAYAMHRSTGIPTAMCREYVNGSKTGEFFIRGVTYIFAKMIKHAVSAADGEVEMCICPWSPILKISLTCE